MNRSPGDVRGRAHVFLLLSFVFAAQGVLAVARPGDASPAPTLVLTQAPAGGAPRARLGERARIVIVKPGSSARVLTGQFHSAADPEVSFDGRRILFAGKKTRSDPWELYEIAVDGSGLRQVTRGHGNSRSPVYAGPFYTIDSTEPWNLVLFVSDAAGEMEEHEPTPSTSLYSCRLDGSDVRRLTYNPSSDRDPVVLSDGRVLFSARQRATLLHGPRGRVSLFAAQTDGLDYALLAGDEGRRIKQMPCVTPDRLVVFVEADRRLRRR